MTSRPGADGPGYTAPGIAAGDVLGARAPPGAYPCPIAEVATVQVSMSATRQGWTSQVSRTPEEVEAFDQRFWAKTTPEQRFEAAWQCVLDWAAMRGIDERELRLQRHVVRVERR